MYFYFLRFSENFILNMFIEGIDTMVKGLSGIRKIIEKNFILFIVLTFTIIIIYKMNMKYKHLANSVKEQMDKVLSITVNENENENENKNKEQFSNNNSTNQFNQFNQNNSDFWYSNMSLPDNVIGCGGRRGACMGGTQIPIPNILPPIDISNRNIAPVTLTTNIQGDMELRQVGVIQKLFGSENEVYPLYGRKQYYNKDRWEYYTVLGPSEVMVPVITKNNYGYEIGTNENVMIQGNSGRYRTIIYERDYPRYIPNIPNISNIY